jgi:hypothetical protein
MLYLSHISIENTKPDRMKRTVSIHVSMKVVAGITLGMTAADGSSWEGAVIRIGTT